MAGNITNGKVIVLVLATIGATVLLGAASMFGMHSSMMGGFASQRLWTSELSMCRGMMGG